MSTLLKTYRRFSSRPFGKKLFSLAVCWRAPYFRTIRPRVEELQPGFGRISMKNRRAVHNHIRTVHAIAMCNLCELTAGLTIDVSLPSHKRWIPMGMEVAYLHKAKTNLTATCQFELPDWEQINDFTIAVSVKDIHDQEVMKAHIKMKVSDKKKKP